MSCLLSLMGNEGIMPELEDLMRNWKFDRDNHIITVLWDKLKGETSYRKHKISCIKVTTSRINVKYTVERLIELKRKEGCVN